ncbi:redoxin domain-containing protein [Pseudochryseolinea flava]|uniref:AhpC/TSA family protein n=1 Tax=Pseudochryseolinea flava TaxID=2059302 RepID=A0A364Y111_9BACT|nr:redoxin domain-containing protein [Pseudochryseolinea flava]RAV99972.1 AhpC/TSA family protein [Pseudochryseolinea flava]
MTILKDMKLHDHQTAIDFTVADIYGNKISLSDFKGMKIHLGFFRNVNCPFCNLRVHQLSKMNKTFEAHGLKLIYFFESDSKLLRKSIFHQEISPIPLIGDPQKKIYGQYGVEASAFKMISTLFVKGTMKDLKASKALQLPAEKDKDATLTLMPADFLIDENFIIQKAHYGKNVNDHIAIEEIKAFAGIGVAECNGSGNISALGGC